MMGGSSSVTQLLGDFLWGEKAVSHRESFGFTPGFQTAANSLQDYLVGEAIAVATLKSITLATLLKTMGWHEQRLTNAGDAAGEAQDAGPAG